MATVVSEGARHRQAGTSQPGSNTYRSSSMLDLEQISSRIATQTRLLRCPGAEKQQQQQQQPAKQQKAKRSEAGKPLGNYLAGIKHYVQVTIYDAHAMLLVLAYL